MRVRLRLGQAVFFVDAHPIELDLAICDNTVDLSRLISLVDQGDFEDSFVFLVVVLLLKGVLHGVDGLLDLLFLVVLAAHEVGRCHPSFP